MNLENIPQGMSRRGLCLELQASAAELVALHDGQHPVECGALNLFRDGVTIYQHDQCSRLVEHNADGIAAYSGICMVQQTVCILPRRFAEQ